MNTITYGKTETVDAIDNHGSFVRRTKKYIDGSPVYPQENYYEIRDKVTTELEAAVVMATLIKDIEENDDIIEAGYRIEGYQNRKKNGYYYIVKCFRSKVFEDKV